MSDDTERAAFRQKRAKEIAKITGAIEYYASLKPGISFHLLMHIIYDHVNQEATTTPILSHKTNEHCYKAIMELAEDTDLEGSGEYPYEKDEP